VFCIFCFHLQFNETLTALSLSKNDRITDVGAAALARAFEVNVTLTEYDGPGAPLPPMDRRVARRSDFIRTSLAALIPETPTAAAYAPASASASPRVSPRPALVSALSRSNSGVLRLPNVVSSFASSAPSSASAPESPSARRVLALPLPDSAPRGALAAAGDDRDGAALSDSQTASASNTAAATATASEPHARAAAAQVAAAAAAKDAKDAAARAKTAYSAASAALDAAAAASELRTRELRTAQSECAEAERRVREANEAVDGLVFCGMCGCCGWCACVCACGRGGCTVGPSFFGGI
jgi:hypothetical protein